MCPYKNKDMQSLLYVWTRLDLLKLDDCKIIIK